MRGKHWDTKEEALRGLEADLNASAQHVVDLMGTEAYIAPGFQETPGEVLGRSHPCGEGLLE